MRAVCLLENLSPMLEFLTLEETQLGTGTVGKYRSYSSLIFSSLHSTFENTTWSDTRDNRVAIRPQEAVNTDHLYFDNSDSMKLVADEVFDTAFEAYDVARLPEIVTTTAPVWRSTQSRRQAIASSLPQLMLKSVDTVRCPYGIISDSHVSNSSSHQRDNDKIFKMYLSISLDQTLASGGISSSSTS
jgi:hypothetical protein